MEQDPHEEFDDPHEFVDSPSVDVPETRKRLLSLKEL